MLCIPPFNYPVNLAVSKIAPALMAGNTVVVKPPTQVRHISHTVQHWHATFMPASVSYMVRYHGRNYVCDMQGAVAATHMIQAFHKAGVPPGVINLVTGAVTPALQILHASPPAPVWLLHLCTRSSSGMCGAGRGSEIGDYLTCHPLVNCISFTGGDTGMATCFLSIFADAHHKHSSFPPHS